MLFHKEEFWYFIIFVYIIINLSPKNFKKYILLTASIYFYAYHEWSHALILVSNIIVNFLCAKNFTHPKKSLWFFYGAILFNILFFTLFSYGQLIIDTSNLFYNTSTNPLHYLHPIGISFITLQTLSYIFDVYRKKIRPENNIVDFALYVSFFPQLASGPLERYNNIKQQLTDNSFYCPNKIKKALLFFIIGLFKKIVLTNMFVPTTTKLLHHPEHFSSASLLLACLFFVIEVYLDFSAYIDMALGIGFLFNIDLSINFLRPFASYSIVDFWNRWHITFSNWIRDYLYYPMLRDITIVHITISNIITFALIGIWHHGGYSSLLWGVLHGIFITIAFLYRYYCKNCLNRKIENIFARIIFFTVLIYSSPLIIAQNLTISKSYYVHIMLNHTGILPNEISTIVPLLSISILIIIFHNVCEFIKTDYRSFLLTKKRYWITTILLLLFLCIRFGIDLNNSYIYLKI